MSLRNKNLPTKNIQCAIRITSEQKKLIVEEFGGVQRFVDYWAPGKKFVFTDSSTRTPLFLDLFSDEEQVALRCLPIGGKVNFKKQWVERIA